MFVLVLSGQSFHTAGVHACSGNSYIQLSQSEAIAQQPVRIIIIIIVILIKLTTSAVHVRDGIIICTRQISCFYSFWCLILATFHIAKINFDSLF